MCSSAPYAACSDWCTFINILLNATNFEPTAMVHQCHGLGPGSHRMWDVRSTSCTHTEIAQHVLTPVPLVAGAQKAATRAFLPWQVAGQDDDQWHHQHHFQGALIFEVSAVGFISLSGYS